MPLTYYMWLVASVRWNDGSAGDLLPRRDRQGGHSDGSAGGLPRRRSWQGGHSIPWKEAWSSPHCGGSLPSISVNVRSFPLICMKFRHNPPYHLETPHWSSSIIWHLAEKVSNIFRRSCTFEYSIKLILDEHALRDLPASVKASKWEEHRASKNHDIHMPPALPRDWFIVKDKTYKTWAEPQKVPRSTF